MFANLCFSQIRRSVPRRMFCVVKKKPLYRRGPFAWTSLVFYASVIGGCYLYANVSAKIEKAKKQALENANAEGEAGQAASGKSIGKADVGGPWVLVNSDGAPVTDASYHGNFTLLYFGFTHCPDICPNELVKLGDLATELERRKLPLVKQVFVSVDPARDSVGQLRTYGQDFHHNIDWLVGTKSQIENISTEYRVYASKANENDEDDEDYLLDHTITMYLLAPNGDFMEFYGQKLSLLEIADRVNNCISTYEQSQIESKESKAQ